MSRTLSIDKIGPGPGFLGQALPLSQPSCGDLGVSLRRSSCSEYPPVAHLCAAIRLLRLGLPWPIRQSRVAGWRLLGACRKEIVRPEWPRIWPQMGIIPRLASVLPLPGRLAVLDHARPTTAQHQHASLRAVMGFEISVDAAPEHRAPPLDEPSHALAVPLAAGSGTRPGKVL